jgi:hypothetical protein
MLNKNNPTHKYINIRNINFRLFKISIFDNSCLKRCKRLLYSFITCLMQNKTIS